MLRANFARAFMDLLLLQTTGVMCRVWCRTGSRSIGLWGTGSPMQGPADMATRAGATSSPSVLLQTLAQSATTPGATASTPHAPCADLPSSLTTHPAAERPSRTHIAATALAAVAGHERRSSRMAQVSAAAAAACSPAAARTRFAIGHASASSIAGMPLTMWAQSRRQPRAAAGPTVAVAAPPAPTSNAAAEPPPFDRSDW